MSDIYPHSLFYNYCIIRSNGNVEDFKNVTELLANPKVDVNYQDYDGWTILMHCIIYYTNKYVFQIAYYLCNHPKININIKTNNNDTTLIIYCKFVDIDTMERLQLLYKLIQISADTNIPSTILERNVNYEYSALMKTIERRLNKVPGRLKHYTVYANLKCKYNTLLAKIKSNNNNFKGSIYNSIIQYSTLKLL